MKHIPVIKCEHMDAEKKTKVPVVNQYGIECLVIHCEECYMALCTAIYVNKFETYEVLPGIQVMPLKTDG